MSLPKSWPKGMVTHPEHIRRDGQVVRYVYRVAVDGVLRGTIVGPEPEGPWQVVSDEGEYIATVGLLREALEKLNVM